MKIGFIPRGIGNDIFAFRRAARFSTKPQYCEIRWQDAGGRRHDQRYFRAAAVRNDYATWPNKIYSGKSTLATQDGREGWSLGTTKLRSGRITLSLRLNSER